MSIKFIVRWNVRAYLAINRLSRVAIVEPSQLVGGMDLDLIERTRRLALANRFWRSKNPGCGRVKISGEH